MRQVERVDAFHQPLIGLGRSARQVVHGTARRGSVPSLLPPFQRVPP
jgi:hypothetical protein